MAELLDVHVPDNLPAPKTASCEDCGGTATRTLAHWMKFAKDIVAERRAGRTGAVSVKHLCANCIEAAISKVNAENAAAVEAGDEPTHGGFTNMPLQLEP